MATKPRPHQEHTATQRWQFIERGITAAIPRPKFAAHYLIQLLRKLAKDKGEDLSDNETCDQTCRDEVADLQYQVAALTEAVNRLQEPAPEEPAPEEPEDQEPEDKGGDNTPAE